MTESVLWSVAGGQWRTHAEQSAAARSLLTEMLGEAAVVVHDDRGVPRLPQHPELNISISHCRTAVAVAISRIGAVGIDIESRRRIDPSLVTRICTPDERDAVDRSDDPTMAFLDLWTKKEAVLKCRGTGIRGFDSMVHALAQPGVKVQALPCRLPDTVAALATATDE